VDGFSGTMVLALTTRIILGVFLTYLYITEGKWSGLMSYLNHCFEICNSKMLTSP